MGPVTMACAGGAGICRSAMAAGAPVSRWTDGIARVLDRVAEREVAAGHLPGAVIAAGDAQAARFLKAYGQLQCRPAPVTMPLDAVFDLASVTKVVGTTTAVSLLLDDARLRLEDPVGRHLPAWRNRPAGEDIRLHHLLTHTSGLPAYLSVGPLAEKHGPGPNPDRVLAAIADLPLRRSPGSGVEYSCLNAILAGRIVENVAGTSLHQFLTERAFRPLGMADTGWFLTRPQLARTVPTDEPGRLGAGDQLLEPAGAATVTHGLVHDPLARYYATAEHCAGNAGLFATAADLGRFARMILGRGELDGVRLLRAETVDRFTRAQTPPGLETRGYGWNVWSTYPFQPQQDTPAGRQAVGHFGFTGTMLWIDKGSGLWAIVLASRLHGGAAASVADLRRCVLEAIVEGARDRLP